MLILRDKGRLVTWQHFKTSWDSSVAQQRRCLWLYSNDSSQVQQEFGTSQIPQNDAGQEGSNKQSTTQTGRGWGESLNYYRQARDTVSKPSKPSFPISGHSSSTQTGPRLRGSAARLSSVWAFQLLFPLLEVNRSDTKDFMEKKKNKRQKKRRQLLCMERAGALNKQKTKGDHVQEGKQRTRTTFPRVRRSQWLHKDICCIRLQYLKKALLSLRCIYTLIGFFLASK